jgi:Domain of unknown function (DUF6362)
MLVCLRYNSDPSSGKLGMSAALPECATVEMITAGAGQLVGYLGCRPESAARWAREIYDTMVRAHCAPRDGLVGLSVKRDWSPELVSGFFLEASDTLRRLPLNSPAPARLKAWWPDIVRSKAEAYASAPVKMRPAAPDPAAIARLDAVTGWLFWLTEDVRRIVWAKANGTAWPLLAGYDGRSERTLRYRHAEAIGAIALRLNQTTPRLHPFAGDPPMTTRRRVR